jgi:pimeloyl-ACP methyl ester carboxylesterase
MTTEAQQAAVRNYREIKELIPSHWSEDRVFANGIYHHYYRTGGDKPPLALLHGFLEGALTWLRAARALEADYDVIMVDARGHGGSDGIGAGYPQELLTEDAAGVIRGLGLGHVHLLGHSQGGTTGIHVAASYPELVRTLSVEGWSDQMDTSSAEPQVNTDFTQSAAYQAWFEGFVAWLTQLKTQTHRERLVASLSQLPPGAPILPEDEYVAWVENSRQLDLDLVRLSPTLWSELDARMRETIGALQRITCPVLIMKSAFFPKPGAAVFVQEESSERRNVKIVRFESTGHLIHREQLDQFVAVVREFLQTHGTSQRER